MNMPLKADLAELRERPVAADSGNAMVRLEAVSKTFAARRGGGAVTALDHIDLAVAPGSVLGVIGRSGAGKSTLIRLVNGLERATAGRIWVDGTDIAGLGERDLRQVRRSIGMIFQHFNLLSSRTAYGNIALPLEIAGVGRAEIKARVEPLLELVGLADKRDRYPAELSGGQKQRVGIARALATRPKVLLSDEATSALDPETTQAILDLLGTINRELGLTVLLITHEMSVIRRIAKEVAVIDSGRIVERGDVYDIFTRPAHPTTQSFLGGASGRAVPAGLAARLVPDRAAGAEAVVRVVFRGPFAAGAVVSSLSRELQLDVKILSGAIDEVAGRPFGTLLLGVPSSDRALTPALAYFAERGLDTEVLGYVA